MDADDKSLFVLVRFEAVANAVAVLVDEPPTGPALCSAPARTALEARSAA